MSKGFFNVPIANNEPVLSYAKGSSERKELLITYNEMYASTIDVPLYIGDQKIYTSEKRDMRPPHDHKHLLGQYSVATSEHIHQAIDAALRARKKWAAMPWHQRVSIFLKAADLLAGPFRAKLNAATMIAQSKNVFQAEICRM